MSNEWLRIVPGDNPEKTVGTQVLMPDGQKVHGVRKITLVAEPDRAWRAVIECHVIVPDEVLAENGSEQDITDLSDKYARRFHATAA